LNDKLSDKNDEKHMQVGSNPALCFGVKPPKLSNILTKFRRLPN